MSEYRYCEFRAIDRPLKAQEKARRESEAAIARSVIFAACILPWMPSSWSAFAEMLTGRNGGKGAGD